MKKIAVLVYPNFSLYEITCLTEALMWYGHTAEIFASSKHPVRSEDGFLITADKTLDEFCLDEYSCLVLPGMMIPFDALFDELLISFLRRFKGENLLIAAISAAPMLLAKAGLLDDVRFTSGIWEEISQNLPFTPYRNIARQPLVKDKNIITASGFAFREFAEEVIRSLEIDPCKNGLFRGIEREYSEQEMTHYMGEQNFLEFMEEYDRYQNASLQEPKQ